MTVNETKSGSNTKLEHGITKGLEVQLFKFIGKQRKSVLALHVETLSHITDALLDNLRLNYTRLLTKVSSGKVFFAK